MIVQYVRDENRNPFAVVVATDKNEIGVAQCNPKDKFVKEIGRKIAAGRAKKNSSWENYVTMSTMNSVQEVVETVKNRSRKYYV